MRNERRDKSREIILEWSLKFNKSFIDALGDGAVNDTILRSIVGFPHTLDLQVTADSVENNW